MSLLQHNPQNNLSSHQYSSSRNLPFWEQIKPFEQVIQSDFTSHKWQVKNTLYGLQAIELFLRKVTTPEIVNQVLLGLKYAPMEVRLTPYILSRIDWSDPISDPIRRQFIPLGSEYVSDHPMLTLDSLAEQSDSKISGLIHRYPDKALFLAHSTCPVYCRFCTRSYFVGSDTDTTKKVHLDNTVQGWRHIFTYLRNHPQIEDIVVSGGDCYNLSPQMLKVIGEALIDIPHIYRVRFATKGLAVDPTKILTDHEWTDRLTQLVEQARKKHKHIALHTHFNHPNEISYLTEDAARILFERGVTVRNQTVLLRGVNDDFNSMLTLIKKLARLHIQPYYVYMHDMVKGVETLRTNLKTNIDLEKQIRGMTAGFYTPTFVTDCPGGGGKRTSCSYEYYNSETGISVYVAPNIKGDRAFLYFDPLSYLTPTVQKAWRNCDDVKDMCCDALSHVDDVSSTWKDSYLKSIQTILSSEPNVLSPVEKQT
jgi:lysine 2,3-aminomutase